MQTFFSNDNFPAKRQYTFDSKPLHAVLKTTTVFPLIIFPQKDSIFFCIFHLAPFKSTNIYIYLFFFAEQLWDLRLWEEWIISANISPYRATIFSKISHKQNNFWVKSKFPALNENNVSSLIFFSPKIRFFPESRPSLVKQIKRIRYYSLLYLPRSVRTLLNLKAKAQQIHFFNRKRWAVLYLFKKIT